MAQENIGFIGVGRMGVRMARRLMDAGFKFEFPEWPEAAEDLVRQWRHRND